VTRFCTAWAALYIAVLGTFEVNRRPKRLIDSAARSVRWRVASHMFIHVYLTARPQYDGAEIKRRVPANEKPPVQKACRNEVRATNHGVNKMTRRLSTSHSVRVGELSRKSARKVHVGDRSTWHVYGSEGLRIGRPGVYSNKTQRRTHTF
jgi:hypothetical protein